jgi:multisubunit Na+/H+ antiporter MnhG subunit
MSKKLQAHPFKLLLLAIIAALTVLNYTPIGDDWSIAAIPAKFFIWLASPILLYALIVSYAHVDSHRDQP